MKNNSSIVQIVVLVVCVIGIVLGILFFSGKIKLPWDKEKQNTLTGSLTVWGTLPYSQMKNIFNPIQVKNDGLRITYVEKKLETMQSDLVNALSSGKGPDVFMMGPGQVAQNIDRLTIIPYDSFSETAYRATFADIGNEFLTNNGVLAFPLFIDPMVMYYNRDLLSSNFIVNPPTTWEELIEMIPVLTKKSDASKISQSTVALGSANNTSYAKDIIVLRVLQSGSRIIEYKNNAWLPSSNLQATFRDVLGWFVRFATPNDPNYSWNQSLPQDRDYFIAGNLAIYFGYPSEAEVIRAKNPNLNFAMTAVPQPSGAKNKINYGRLYSLGISKVSKNIPAAVGLANTLTSKETLSQLIQGTFYAPARRDLLSVKPKDAPEQVVIYNSAIISRNFFDPDAMGTSRLLINSINQVNSGTKTAGDAATVVVGGINDLISKILLPETP